MTSKIVLENDPPKSEKTICRLKEHPRSSIALPVRNHYHLQRHRNNDGNHNNSQLIEGRKFLKPSMLSGGRLTVREGGEEARSILNFSCESLSISNSGSDFEPRGIVGNKHQHRSCFHLYKKTSALALILTLVLSSSCVIMLIEVWMAKGVLSNSRDIEELASDVETLKHLFREKSLMEELRTFEEQACTNYLPWICWNLNEYGTKFEFVKI